MGVAPQCKEQISVYMSAMHEEKNSKNITANIVYFSIWMRPDIILAAHEKS